jgi:hypothetical protein
MAAMARKKIDSTFLTIVCGILVAALAFVAALVLMGRL